MSVAAIVVSSPAWAQTPPAAAGVCPAGSTEPIARRVSPSIVQVEGPGGAAHGFVFGSDRLVVVPLAVVEPARGIVLHGASGEVRRPTVVVVDHDHGLALLEMATPLPDAQPLVPSAQRIERGTAVLAFSGADLLAPADVVTPGSVTRVTGDHLLTSARPGYSSWGSPLVDCDGRVLGISMPFDGDDAVRVDMLPALVARSGNALAYSSGWSVAPGIGTMFSFGRGDPWLGFFFGAALVEEDRLELSTRVQASVLVEPSAPGEPVQSGLRLAADMRVGYRFLLTEGFMPFYFVPSVGAVGGWEGRWRSEPQPDARGGGCSRRSTCSTAPAPTPTYLGDRKWIAPIFGAAFRMGPAELGYSLQPDAHDLSLSTHTLTLGFQL